VGHADRPALGQVGAQVRLLTPFTTSWTAIAESAEFRTLFAQLQTDDDVNDELN